MTSRDTNNSADDEFGFVYDEPLKKRRFSYAKKNKNRKSADYVVTVWKKDYGDWPFMLAKNTEEWGNFTKKDVKEHIENYYKLGADKVVARKKSKKTNIIWSDEETDK